MKALKSRTAFEILRQWITKISLFYKTKPIEPLKPLSSRAWLSLNFEEAIKIPGLGRINISPQNIVTVKYSAADPSDNHTKFFNTTAGSNDNYRAQLLVGIKDHTIKLCRIIRDLDANCEFKQVISTGYNWDSVRNHLHMAASLNDVYADTSLVDDSGSISYCRPAWEFEEAHSEVVSKFIAAQIFFNFIWMAYECAIEIAGEGKSIKKKTGAKGRVILSESKLSENQIPYAKQLYLLGIKSCYDDLSLRRSKEIKDLLSCLHGSPIVQSAEIVRIIRNRVMHGDETAGDPEDYGGLGENSFSNPTQRLYCASRLTLLLIQSLALTCIENCLDIMQSDYEGNFDSEGDISHVRSIGFVLRNAHIFEASKSFDQMEFNWIY